MCFLGGVNLVDRLAFAHTPNFYPIQHGLSSKYARSARSLLGYPDTQLEQPKDRHSSEAQEVPHRIPDKNFFHVSSQEAEKT